MHAMTHALTTQELNVNDRLLSYTDQSSPKCDKNDLIPGWYRFPGVSGNLTMPTACPTDVRVCNTHAPGCLNGQHPTTDEGEVTRQVCCHWLSNCYKWSNNIKVKNCGAYYVYEQQKKTRMQSSMLWLVSTFRRNNSRPQ